MRFPGFCLVLALPLVACAQSPAPAALPESFKVVYEVDNLDGEAVRTNRLEATWEKGKGRLVLDLVERGEKKHHEADPWPETDALALWQQVEGAKLFDFKPQQGDATPHFSPVRLTAEASAAGSKRACAHAWSAPLRNDGQVWALKDLLDRLVANPPAGGASPQPSASPEASK